MRARERLVELSDLAAYAATVLPDEVEAAAAVLVESLLNGGQILVCGNGGSAAQASHFAAELTGRYRADREPLPAVALSADPAALTCIGNDFGFERVFARQVEAFAPLGGALVCLTTSGRSMNVRLAAHAAAREGLDVVWVTGAVNGDAAVPLDACTAAVRIPSTDTALVQEVTLSVLHSFCERIEREVE